MSESLPYIHFYPGDWKKDPGVASLSLPAKGLWIEMLILMHESPVYGCLLLSSGQPPTLSQLARIAGCDSRHIARPFNELASAGVFQQVPDAGGNAAKVPTTTGTQPGRISPVEPDACLQPGTVYCRRMIRDAKLRETRANVGRIGAEKTNQRFKKTPDLPQQNEASLPQQNSALIVIDTVIDKEEAKNSSPLPPPPKAPNGAPAALEPDLEPVAQKHYSQHPRHSSLHSVQHMVMELDRKVRASGLPLVRGGEPCRDPVQFWARVASQHALNCGSARWLEDGGKWVPALDKWLANWGWLDEVPPERKPPMYDKRTQAMRDSFMEYQRRKANGK